MTDNSTVTEPKTSLDTSLENGRFAKRFAELKTSGQKGFIPFSLLGWPDKSQSFELIRSMVKSGATALELGFPFSDPLADGPVLQQAAVEALEKDFKVSDALDVIAQVRALDAELPIGLMVYYNMIMARGIDGFFKAVSDVGVDGVLIVDLPAELAEEVAQSAQKHQVDLIFIVSPLTSDERLAQILKYASGYLYIVARLGVTGVDNTEDSELAQLIQRVQGQTDLPLYVGFGISSPEDAQRVFAYGADGAITGSKIIQLASESKTMGYQEVSRFIEQMINVTQVK